MKIAIKFYQTKLPHVSSVLTTSAKRVAYFMSLKKISVAQEQHINCQIISWQVDRIPLFKAMINDWAYVMIHCHKTMNCFSNISVIFSVQFIGKNVQGPKHTAFYPLLFTHYFLAITFYRTLSAEEQANLSESYFIGSEHFTIWVFIVLSLNLFMKWQLPRLLIKTTIVM